MSNENKVVLPEPIPQWLRDMEWCVIEYDRSGYSQAWCPQCGGCKTDYFGGKAGHKDGCEFRALLATGGQAQAVRLLAEDHSGMKVDYRGLFSQVQRVIKRTDPGYSEMLRQLEGHLQELGQRWYAGDTDVVDEILQLYCIERDARKTVAASATAAPQAQADSRDAERYRYLKANVLTGSIGFGDSWISAEDIAEELDEFMDSSIAAAQPPAFKRSKEDDTEGGEL